MQHAWERWEICTTFQSETLNEGDYLRDPSIKRRIILKCILNKVWESGFLWTRHWTFGLH